MEPYLEQQDRIEAFKKYFAAKNSAITDKGVGGPELDDDAIVFEETSNKTISANWGEWVALNAIEYKASVTTEPATVHIIVHETGSPFDELSEQQDDDDKVLEIIEHVRKQLNVNFAQRLAYRLDYLFNISNEEDPDDIAISPDSLRNFIGFMQSAPYLKYPDVVITPSKNIRAQWRTAPNRHFAVEFIPTGEAYFVIFSPDHNFPERTIRMSGLVSVDSLMETVQPHGILSWSSQ